MSDDLHALAREAESYFSQRDWDLALEKYQQIIQMDPQNEDACEKLARVYAVRGLVSNVIAQYFQLLAILEGKSELDLALEVARWIIQLQPENDKARVSQINILGKKGMQEEVVQQSLQLARLHIELGQGDQSIELLKTVQQMQPDNLEIGYELAEMYVSHGNIQEGASQFRQIANSFLEKELYEKAADAFKRMKVIQPDDPGLLFTLGNIYVTLGRLNDAEAEFRSILRHDLNHLEALMALGNVCQQKGQFRDAILAFNKILSINPQETLAKEKLGELYQAQGNANAAIKQFLSAATTYQSVEENQKAVRLYQRVVALDPTNPTACRELTNMGAAMISEEDTDQPSIYQPIIEPVVAPKTQPTEGGELVPQVAIVAEMGMQDAPADDIPDEHVSRRPSVETVSATDTDGGTGGLVSRMHAAATTGKPKDPRPGLMSARTSSLIPKAEGTQGSKPRMRGGDTSGSTRTRPSDMGGSKPHLRRRRGTAVRETENASASATPESQAFAHSGPSDVPESTDVRQEQSVEWGPAPGQEESLLNARDGVDDDGHSYGNHTVVFDTEPEQEFDAEAWPSSKDQGSDEYDPTLFPNLEEPTGRPEAPHGPVASVAEPPSQEESAPVRPRLFARGGGRSLGGRFRPARVHAQEAATHNGSSGARSEPGFVKEKAEPEELGAAMKPEVPGASGPDEIAAAQLEPDAPASRVVMSVSEGIPQAPAFLTGQAVSRESRGEATLLRSTSASGFGGDLATPRGSIGGLVTTTEQAFASADVDALVQAAASSEIPTQVAPSVASIEGARALEELSRGSPDTFPGGDAADASFETGNLEEYIRSGDISRAILALRSSIQDSAGDLQLRARLADVLFVHDQVEEAATEYVQLARLNPENIGVLMRLIETYLWSDEPARAIDLLVTLSFIYRQLGNTDLAFQVLQDALMIDHHHERARLELAELYRQSGATDLANWHLRAMAQSADERNDGAAAIDTYRKLFDISGDAADRERLAAALEKHGHGDEAVLEYKQLAECAKQQGNINRARDLYERIIYLMPTDASVHEALMSIYQETGDEIRAVDKMRMLGSMARDKGDVDAALRFFEEASRRVPTSLDDRRTVVELYLSKGLVKNARSEARDLLDAWFRENQFELAIPLLLRFVETSPDDIELREQLVHFYEKAGDNERAIEARTNLGKIYVQRGAHNDALKEYQKALGLDDSNAGLYFELGVLYADALNDPESAEKHFATARRLDPTHKDAMRRLVQLQLQSNKISDAIALLTDLSRQTPETAAILNDLTAEYERRRVVDPRDASVKFTLGMLYRAKSLMDGTKSRLDDAIQLFQETRKVSDLFLQSCNMLGLCFYERQALSYEEHAIKWFKKGLETKGYEDEEYLELRYNLAELYNRRNDVDEALALYQSIGLVDIDYRDVAEKIKQLNEEITGGGKITRLRKGAGGA